ncbi:purine permease, partial [Enterococcus faecalis]
TGVIGTALAFGIDVTLSTGSLPGFATSVTTIFGNSEVILTTLVAVLLNVILKPKKCGALE